MERVTCILAVVMVMLGSSCATPGVAEHTEAVGMKMSPERENELSILIRGYLKVFEDLRGKPEFKDSRETMENVKLLIVQAWIYMLRPDVTLLKDIIPVDGQDTLETLKENTIATLKTIDAKSSMGDSILHYVKIVKPKVQEVLTNEVKTQHESWLELEKKIEKEGDEKTKEELIKISDEKNDKLEDARSFMDFCNIATKMALQSYVFDFIDVFEIISSDGKTSRDFTMPPLYQTSFMDFLEQDDSDDDEYNEGDSAEDDNDGDKEGKQ